MVSKKQQQSKILEDLNNFRFERKFFITELSGPEIEILVKSHPAMFSEFYPPRFVNNIYFDTIDLRNYFDTVNGLSERKKTRIRWYGDLLGKIEQPLLEFKLKQGYLVRKETFPLNSFSLHRSTRIREHLETLWKSAIPEWVRQKLKSMQPILVNRYHRRYFESANRSYRITVDTDINVCRLDNNQSLPLYNVFSKVPIILELKYRYDQDDLANEITNHFPVRVSKNSKYVVGVMGVT